MPEVIIDQRGTVKNMTDSEYRSHTETAKHNGQDVYASTDTGTSVSIWDCVDETWSKPLPRDQVYQHYLKKYVFKCSACSYHTLYTGDSSGSIANHVKRVTAQGKLHQSAEVISQQNAVGQIAHQCSGCGSEFSARKGQCALHIEALQNAPKLHATVAEIAMKRFSLDASMPIILSENILIVSEEASTEEQIVERSKRKRRKNRNRGKSNGYRNE